MGSNKRSETQGARCCPAAGHTATYQTERQQGGGSRQIERQTVGEIIGVFDRAEKKLLIFQTKT